MYCLKDPKKKKLINYIIGKENKFRIGSVLCVYLWTLRSKNLMMDISLRTQNQSFKWQRTKLLSKCFSLITISEVSKSSITFVSYYKVHCLWPTKLSIHSQTNPWMSSTMFSICAKPSSQLRSSMQFYNSTNKMRSSM